MDQESAKKSYSPYHYAVITEGCKRPPAYFGEESDAEEWASSHNGRVMEWYLPLQTLCGSAQINKSTG